MTVHVLLNPASGDGRARRRWRALEGEARALFGELAIHESSTRGDLGRIAAGLSLRDDLVLAAGGDGTSHEVLNGLLTGLLTGGPIAATMGWIPIGSGNDLARAVGLLRPGVHPIQAYRSYRTKPIDVGRVWFFDQAGRPQHLWFGNSFSLGVSADVLRLVARTGKRFGGRASYFLGALRAISRHQPIRTRLTIDGSALDPGPCRLISISNSPTFGAGMRIAPAARVDDGRLDLLWLSGLSRLATAGVLPQIYWGGHLKHPAVTAMAVRRVEIETDGPLDFETDGELNLGYPPFRVEVEPGGLRTARFGAP